MNLLGGLIWSKKLTRLQYEMIKSWKVVIKNDCVNIPINGDLSGTKFC